MNKDNLLETIKSWKEMFLEYIKYKKKYSKNTLKSYDIIISDFISFLDKNNFTYKNRPVNIYDIDITIFEHFCFFGDFSEKTSNLRLYVLRSFFDFLEQRVDNFVNNIKKIKGIKEKQKVPVYLQEDEISLLQKTILNSNSPFRLRDYTILNFFIKTGLRASELINLEKEAIILNGNGGRFKVVRKGNKEQILPITPNLLETLNEYLVWREEYLIDKNKDIKLLFFTKNCNKFDISGLRKVFLKYFKQAGLNLDKQGLHIFRHTTAYLLFKEKINVRAIQKFLGHSSLQTTARYGDLILQEHFDTISDSLDKI